MTTGKPNIGTAMMEVHHAITRGLAVSGERGAHYAREGYPDAAIAEGFATYVRSLTWVIHAHHVAEDKVVFPYLKPKLPGAPYEELSFEHEQMQAMLDDLARVLPALVPQARSQETLPALLETLARLGGMWQPHIAKEELHLYAPERTAAVMTEDEHAALTQQAAQLAQQQADPAYLLPFILYNLAPEERADIMRVLPPAVLEQMVPVVWKEKWAPMQPFLLP